MKKIRVFTVLAMVAMMIIFTGFSTVMAQDNTEDSESCVKPAKGPLGVTGTEGSPASPGFNPCRATIAPTARVGKPAPDFEASAYVDGRFKNIRLSEYKGQWVVLCFYPGDFTFV